MKLARLKIAQNFTDFCNHRKNVAFFVAFLFAVCETANLPTNEIETALTAYEQTNNPLHFQTAVTNLQKLI